VDDEMGKKRKRSLKSLKSEIERLKKEEERLELEEKIEEKKKSIKEKKRGKSKLWKIGKAAMNVLDDLTKPPPKTKKRRKGKSVF